MPSRHSIAVWLLFCNCSLSSCSWCPWGKPDGPQSFGVVSVQLRKPPPKGKLRTYAIAKVHKGRHLKDAGFKMVTKEGAASFVLPMGHIYDVRIFHDLNRNQVHDATEPSGLVENVMPAAATSAGVLVMEFGQVGAVNGGPLPHQRPPSVPAPTSNPREVPPEAAPYLKYVPQWVQDRVLQ